MTDKERIEPKTAEQFDYSQLSADGKIYYWMSEYNKLKRQVSEKDKLISELVPVCEKALYFVKGILDYLPNDDNRAEYEEIKSLIKKASNPKDV